jgi:PAS domain S-box-containing protein
MVGRVVAEHPVFLSTAPAESGDRRLALVVVVVSLLIFLSLVPFARQPLPQVWAFIPIYESALAISDSITAAILLIQFNILRSRALLALACGYLFTALMTISHALTFPGLFAPTGLLGAGPQSTAWLYVFWHGGFPLAVISYALLKERQDATEPPAEAGRSALSLSVGAVIAAVVSLTLLATVGKAFLPDVLTGGVNGVGLVITIGTDLTLTLAALLMLWLRRPHTVLDVWLMVVMCAWLFDVALSALLNHARFDVGFYAGRAYGLLAGTFVLLVLLQETGALYAQLARLFEAEHQERKREAEERRRIFETSLDLILVVDRKGGILRVSPSAATILGYEPAELVGRSAGDFVHSDDLDAIRSEMRRARSGHFIRNFATRYVHKDGRIVTLAWSGVWSDPEQRHFFIGRDVTEQKRIERMKDEFIATVSHELRTPVTSIAGPLGLLAAGAAGDLADSAKRLVAMAHNNSGRLVRLINDILDIEKIESGKMAFNFQRVDAKRLTERAIEATRALAEQFGVPVRLDTDIDDAAVHTDSDRLMHVLTNLLSNAIKFSPRGAQAVVSIEPRDHQIRIAVRDHGPGIPDEFKTLIFEKFAQVDATDARQKGGTGLGLSIVRETMIQLGGSVGHFAAPSGGTIFYVDIPCWNGGAPPEWGQSDQRKAGETACAPEARPPQIWAETKAATELH